VNTTHLPEAFLAAMRAKLGDDVDAFIEEHNNPAPVSVRINPFKCAPVFADAEKIPWATNARFLPERISFTLDPLFHAGCYYVQEASSMFLEMVLKQLLPEFKDPVILDSCAAPGGKTTHILATLAGKGLVVSNEIIPGRNKILMQNVIKWGCDNVVVTQNETSVFGKLPGMFDMLVVDAPCSGEGLFRKDKEATTEWSPDQVANCAIRQRSILNDLYPSLKQNGYLIYSTCTYEASENEEQVQRMMYEYDMELVPLNTFGTNAVNTGFGYQFYPHKCKGEGFFISVLRKKQSAKNQQGSDKTSKATAQNNFLEQFLTKATDFVPVKVKDEIFAFPSKWLNTISLLREALFVRKAGIHLGTMKGTDFIPSPELALSIHLNPETPKVALELNQALDYLRCGNINIPNLTKGWHVVTFNGFALGWIKALGNRINNYFPKEWRILHK
jgi:16S rRNA C967 or C1407 C5-methylase (RsmB/RsmF family)/NOL1/NOP2/fmu family ribosome biogenesis protein